MLTQELLRQLLHYDSETGIFTWKVATARRIKPGSVAGALEWNGYVRFHVRGRTYMAHRLAWLYMTGGWPVAEIDHIDGVRSNNAWANLRAATPTENARNRKIRRDNLTGYKGVHHRPDVISVQYQATISVAGSVISLGYFATPEAAHAAYIAEAKRRFGEFARAS